MWLGTILGALCLMMLTTSCNTLRPTTNPPQHCQTIHEWTEKVPVSRARLTATGADEGARLGREDYLEGVCKGINAFRKVTIGKY